ncbi:phage tail protein [Streptomyces netropsis]
MNSGESLLANSFTVELGGLHVETIQSVSEVSLTQNVVEIKQVSPSGELIIRKQPGSLPAGEITITRAQDRSHVFTDWINKTREKKPNATEHIAVVTKDSAKKTVKRIEMTNAWVSNWVQSGLSAGEDSPVTETVTLTFEEISVKKYK